MKELNKTTEDSPHFSVFKGEGGCVGVLKLKHSEPFALFKTEGETCIALSPQTVICSAYLFTIFNHHFLWTKRKEKKQSTTKAANTGNSIQETVEKTWGKKTKKTKQIYNV